MVAVHHHLVGRGGLRHTSDGAAGDADGASSELLYLLTGQEGVVDPSLVEAEGTLGHSLVPIAGRVHPSVSAVEELEEVVLRLIGLAGIAYPADRQLGILHPVMLLAALPHGPPIVADDAGVAEVAVDSVMTGRIRHGHVHVVHPGHALGHHDLLVLGWIHVPLAADDELGPLHSAVPPDLRVVAVVTDDQRHLNPLGTLGHVRVVAGVPSLDGAPW
mmetsp:Transcript_22366/g.73490  ORF Transcript_22366/g.73490 Transcript_22366/m.73490 type:complete len:217 (+) Transcript_22366:114-764(+)